MNRSKRWTGALAALGLSAAVLLGAPPVQGATDGAATTHRWFPEGALYEPYLAEINRPGMGLTVVGVDGSGIDGAGDLRFGLKLGGRFGLLRLGAPTGERGRQWQLGIGAGFYGQFDIENSLDNLGWDGLYSLLLTNGPADGDGPSFKLGTQHWSSHVGDELSERTGRQRIGYTREEVVAGVSWPLLFGLDRARRLRLYAEGAYGFSGHARDPQGVDLQEPGRAQAGVELEAPGSLGSTGRWGWYTAFDANAFQERSWQPNVSLGSGFLVDDGDRRWRLGVTLYDGRQPIGEFFQVDERYAILGLWLDLTRPAQAVRTP